MADLNDSASEFEKMKAASAAMAQNAKELEKGIGGYADILIKINKTQNDILHVQQEKLKEEKALADFEASMHAKRLRYEKLLTGASKKSRDFAQKKLGLLEAEVQIRKDNVKLLGLKVDKEKESLATLKQTVKESNKLKAIANSTASFVKKWGFDKLKEYGVFDMDKEIRNAGRSMGIGSNQAKAFSLNLQQAGDHTSLMGVGTKELAKMQKGYSEEIGRSVQLTEKGLVAMAEMSMGTGLGEQFAIGMAGAMDKFGGSVETSRDLIQETVDTAGEMGVNSAKAAEMLSKNLKLAQKYKFKGGVKGLAKMSTEALKLRLDLDGIAGLADKVFRPEGAIEMAAKLQTMGGAFAQMADPMQLMFKARNDFEGFAKDIGKATSEFVEYNKENGTFDIKGGLAADRMREIANMTGLSVEKLQEMAVAQKKIDTIGAVTPISFSSEDDALVSSLAKIGEDGEITVNVDGLSKSVKELSANDLKNLKADKKSLEKRAKDSRTAAETLDDIKTSFTQLLIPIAEALKTDFAEPLRNLVNNTEFKKTIRSFVTGVANIAGAITKFMIDNPISSAVAALAAWGGLKALTWIMNGRMLAKGFNMVANAGGGNGSSSILDSVTGKRGKAGKPSAGKYMKSGMKMMKGGKGLKGISAMTKGLGKGFAPLAIAGAGMDLFGNMNDDSLDTGDALLKTLDENKMMALGAGVGSLLGPGGTMAGAGIGGMLDMVVPTIGDYRPDASSQGVGMAMNDGIIKFNPKDKFMQMNDGVVMASTAEGQLHKSAKELSGGGKSEVTHKFENIKIDITINATGMDTEIAKGLINNNRFIEDINIKIKEVASKVMSGGVLNPTPK